MKALFFRFISLSVLLFLCLSASNVQAQTLASPYHLQPASAEKRLLNSEISAIPDKYEKSGAPGSTVTFNIALTTAGPDNISVSATSPWTVNATNPVSIDSGNTGSAQITVVIPENAKSGDSVDVVVTFTSGQSGASISQTYKVSVVQPSSARPIVVIDSYYLDKDTIKPDESFGLFLSLKNNGGEDAHNLIFSFQGEEFTPEETGGVVAIGSLEAGASRDISQRLRASASLWGKTTGSVPVRLTYNNPSGEVFTESFVVNLPVLGWSGTWATATPTPTGTAMPRAQLVVSGYQSDVDPLQPGSIFNLKLDMQNLGSGDAQAVTMVLGGGAVPSVSETPQPGGVSGAGADLTTFAPLGTSNLVYLGDVKVGESAQATQKLIVNVAANPGAYALKLSFVYTDAKGNRQVDDQVITLLIYQMPQVEVNFYRDPGPITAMQPNNLPIQVVNMGRKFSVLGNMTVSAEGGDLMNNVSLVGTLDAGGYFPLDVMLIPHNPGPMELNVTINYTDDFNQPRSIVQTIKLDVMEGAPPVDPGMEGPGGPGMDPGMNGGPIMGPDGVAGGMPPVEETFWQKALRFLKGLVGLDSAPPQPEVPVMFPGDMPPGAEPMPVMPERKR